MLVWIEQDLFESSEAFSLRLLEVFSLASDGRHVLLTRPPFISPLTSPINAWLDRFPEHTRLQVEQILNQGIEAAANADAKACRITIVAAGESAVPHARFALHQAILLLRQPLRLMLEDRHSDLGFLLKLCPPVQRRQLRDAIAAGGIEIMHGGGLPNIQTAIKAMARDEASKMERLQLLRL